MKYGLWLVMTLWLGVGVATAQSPQTQAAPSWVEVQPVLVKSFARQHTRGTQHAGDAPRQSPHPPTGNAPRQSPHPPMQTTPRSSSRTGQGTAPAAQKGQTGSNSMRDSMAEQQRVLAMRMNHEQTLQYQRLISMIISPCCWTQPVSLHSSKLSDAIKIDVQRRLLAGQNEKQIIAAYKKRFGERVLSIPEKSYIFLIPLAASLLALFLVSIVILRWTQRSSSSVPTADVSSLHSEDSSEVIAESTADQGAEESASEAQSSRSS